MSECLNYRSTINTNKYQSVILLSFITTQLSRYITLIRVLLEVIIFCVSSQIAHKLLYEKVNIFMNQFEIDGVEKK